MKVKKEVRDLCLRLRNAKPHSREFEKLQDILESKYKFTAYNLVALWQNPPTIEYTMENIDLIKETK